EPADQLVDERRQVALVGDAALDPLGDQLAAVGLALPVAVARAGAHGAQRAHPAVGLEAAALVDDRLPRALGQAGEQAPDHDAVGPGRQRLGDVAGVADAAVGDDGGPAVGGAPGGLVDGGHLGDADPRDHPGGADRPRPDADLDRVGPGLDQVA